jgi:DNA modification methylase
MRYQIIEGDCIESMRVMPAQSVHCCVTSPPYYGLRDYGVDGQIGMEPAAQDFIEKMVEVFREVRRVLRDDGTLWVNLGDSYVGSWGAQGRTGAVSDRSAVSARQIASAQRKATRTGSARPWGLPAKSLMGMPWRVALALQEDGWILRNDIIWHKPNPMPSSVTDRCTNAHEHIFMFAKSPRYYYDSKSVRTEITQNKGSGNGFARAERVSVSGRGSAKKYAPPKDSKRNRRDVWTVASQPFKGAHFATFPPKLIEPCILAGCPEGGTVLDPFGGSGTTAIVALNNRRRAILCELSPTYIDIAHKRIASPKTAQARLL